MEVLHRWPIPLGRELAVTKVRVTNSIIPLVLVLKWIWNMDLNSAQIVLSIVESWTLYALVFFHSTKQNSWFDSLFVSFSTDFGLRVEITVLSHWICYLCSIMLLQSKILWSTVFLYEVIVLRIYLYTTYYFFKYIKDN